MTHDTQNPLLIVLCKGATGNRVAVELESFLKFNAQMDFELQHLVDRWSDYMTPNSQRAPRPDSRRR